MYAQALKEQKCFPEVELQSLFTLLLFLAMSVSGKVNVYGIKSVGIMFMLLSFRKCI